MPWVPWRSAIRTRTPPWFVGPTVTGGALGENCTTHIEFTATVYDNCGIDAGNVGLYLSTEGQAEVDLDTMVQQTTQIDPTTVEVLLGFDIVGILQGPVSISLYLTATDLAGNFATSNTATVYLTDGFSPEITSLTVTPQDGVVGRLASGEELFEIVTVEGTARDNCCLDLTDWIGGTNLPITLTASNASTMGPITGVMDTSNYPKEITFTYTYYVYGLTASPSIPEASVTVTDCYGATVTESASGSDIVDDEEPQLSGILIVPESISATDGTCACTILFTAGIQDNCFIDLDSIVVAATSPGATVSGLTYTVAPTYFTPPGGETDVCMQAVIEGSFVVSDLTGCTTTPSVQVDVADRTGNEAHFSGTASEISRGVPPTCSTITLTPASESLDADCGVNFTYQATVSDPCGMSGDDITATPYVMNGDFAGHTVSVTQDPTDPHAWNVSGSFRANCDGSYSGDLCTMAVAVAILAQTCYYAEPQAIGVSDTVSILDATPPTVSGFTLTATGTDFEPEGTLVSYQATITDNCCLDLDLPWLGVSAEAIDATVSIPTVTTSPSSGMATQVSISGNFLVSGFAGCAVDIEATIMAYDCCGNMVTEAQTIHLADETAPTISEITMTSDDGDWLVDGSCEQTVNFVFTVNDNYCIDPADISVTPAVTNGAIKGFSVQKTPSSGTTDQVVVTWSFVVYELNGCPAEPNLTVQAEDCCGNVATTTQAAPHIRDEVSPTFDAVTVSDETVDGNCEATVTFSATVTDNCCVTPGGVAVNVTLPTGNATLGPPTINKMQNGQGRVDISGWVLVSNLGGCPATVRVTVDAADCCGNGATQAWETGDVSDTIDPVISGVTVSDETVDGNCEATVTFSATVTDNCCVTPGGVTVIGHADD